MEAGAARIVTTTTIPHASNAVDVSPLLAGALAASTDTFSVGRELEAVQARV